MSLTQEPLISKTPAWQALRAHQARVADVHMRALFNEDPRRAARFSLKEAGLYLDYSKNRIVAETVRLLHDLAHTARLEHAIGRMFAGERINTTEGRAVLHTALRNRGAEAVIVDGEDVMPSVRTVLARMRTFSEAVHSGEYRGMSGAPFTDVVNIGIGGSHLGPLLVTRALRLIKSSPARSLRLQRRSHGHRRDPGRGRTPHHAVRDRLEDLEGAYRMDRHFRSTPFEANLPVVLGLLSLWYTDFFGAQSRAVIPYDQHLEYLPAYLQQVEMESNGEGVTLSGSALDYPMRAGCLGRARHQRVACLLSTAPSGHFTHPRRFSDGPARSPSP